MILYPALDILDGRVVRLVQGDFDQRTEYADEPLAAALAAAHPVREQPQPVV